MAEALMVSVEMGTTETARSSGPDAVTQEIVRNRFDVIAQEMEETLLRASFSPIVKEGLDASAAVFDPKGNNIAQAAAHPIHLGCLVPAIRTFLDKWPADEMRPGDCFVLNDPYQGGTHLPDIVIAAPVFSSEGRLLAMTTTMCHHQEMGGLVAGSLPPTATELVQEGFCVPPMRLMSSGELNESFMALLAANVRIPEVVLGDLQAQLAATAVADRRIQELVEEFGADNVEEITEALLSHSEQMTRDQIELIPNGTYTFEDYLDDDGVNRGERITIRAAVTVEDRSLHVDFTGSNAQTDGPFNCVPSSTMSSLFYVLRALTGSDIPNNSGCYRAIDATLPEGSIVNPRRGAAVNSRTATIKRITDTVFGCLVQAVPERLAAASCGQLLVMNFGGRYAETGEAFVTSELGAGGMGARPGKDGVDCIETDATNGMSIPAEAFEMESPLRVMGWGMWRDSSGPGEWRGGLGMWKVFRLEDGTASVTYRGERHTTAPWGVEGGGKAASSRAFIRRSDGREEELPSKCIIHLSGGDELHIFISGGGGYGDPLRRSVDAVARDVREGYISDEHAAKYYGVLFDDAMKVDETGTESCRKALETERGVA